LALAPLDDVEQVEEAHVRVGEVRCLLREGSSIPVGGVDDVAGALERASKEAMLAPEEILACAALIRAAAQVRRFLGPRRAELPRLWRLAGGLVDLSGLASRVDEAFEPSGRLKDTASDALLTYRTRARQLHGQIKERVEGMLGDPDHQVYLQDSFFSVRNDRYVLPIKASFRRQVPGIVHNASNSGQTLFIEPQQLVDLGNELSIAESLAAEEERQVLTEFSGYLGDRASDLDDAIERLAVIDEAQAAGELADRLDATSPSLVSASEPLHLLQARHPLLALQGKKVVANDIRLEADQRALVVSGPNAGGKTVTITTVGLSAVMARAGLPIPASPDSVLPLFDGLATAMGDEQDLSRDLSTFSAHLTRLKAIHERAAAGWLVVIDEIAADTDPKEGAALATSMLEALVEGGARVLVTTHLDDVKALGLTDGRFVNARVGFDPETLAPSYTLELGQAGASNAIDIARRVGLPESILERARSRLSEGGALSLALARLEEEQARASALGRRLDEQNREAERARAGLERLTHEAELARREAEVRVRRELEAELGENREQVRRLIAALQVAPKISEAQAAQRQIEAKLEETRRAADRLQAAGSEPIGLTADQLSVGLRVRVVSLGQLGEVLAVDEAGALVGIGAMRTRVAFSDLSKVTGQAPREVSRRHKGADVAERPLDNPSARCDVRGLRADEALREVESFLDRSSYLGPSTIEIVHGHGTGALKKAVREALKNLPYVAEFRPGRMHEGGDGVTIVELRS
jgi:DNA mismatch repair protein MutS2